MDAPQNPRDSVDQDPTKDPYPDTSYLGQLVRMGRTEFERREELDHTRELMYWGMNEVPHPAHIDHQEVHMRTCAEMVQRLKGILDDRPTVQIGETSLSDLKITEASKVQDACNAVWPSLEDDIEDSVWEKVLEDQMRFGRGYDVLEYTPLVRSEKAEGFVKVTDYNNNPDDPNYIKAKKEFDVFAPLPLVWRHHPARGSYVWYDDEGISEALFLEERRVREVTRRYRCPGLVKQLEAKSQNGLTHVIFGRYWNRTYGAYFASQAYSMGTWDESTWKGTSLINRISSVEVVDDPFENPYGRPPVVETEGMTSTSKDPARRQMAIFDHVIGLASYLDTLVSQKASAVRVYAWPTAILENIGVNGTVLAQSPVGLDGRPAPIEIEPGKMIQLLPGERISWLVVPHSPGADIDSQILLIQKQADSLGISSAVFDATALQSNGYLYNSVVNAIRSKFKPLVKHTIRAHRKRVQLFMDIIKLHGSPIYLRKPGDTAGEYGEWLDISPKDLDGHFYTIDPLYEDKLPTDDASNAALAAQLTDPNHPLVTDNYARKKWLGIENPQREENALLIQEYKNTVGKQFVLAQAVKQSGMQQDQEEQSTPQDILAKLGPNAANLPPAFLQALSTAAGPGVQAPGGQGGSPSANPMGGAPGGATMGAPTSMGGIPGAPAAPVIPGIGRSLTPPPPSGGMKPGPKKKGGRAAGQSHAPGNMKPAGGP